MKNERPGPIGPTLICLLALGACGPPDDGHAEDDGHDHADEVEAPQAAEPDPAAHDESAEDRVVLSALQRARIGLRLQPAGPASLDLARSFPGQVLLEPDRVMHVVPQAPGIVRETLKTIGDRVEAGEALAWIESSELAEAKLAFFAAAAEFGRCQIVLPRAQEIHENVVALLGVLAEGGSTEEIAALDGREMGEWRGSLLRAQAELTSSRATLERERALRERGISSEEGLIDAAAAFARARATLDADMDLARYRTLLAFGQEARARQVAELGLVAAENRLRILGVEESWIERLRDLVPQPSTLEHYTCPDPDCPEDEIPSVDEGLKGESNLGRYALRAQQAGVITEKHLALGERVSGQESVLVVVDTSRVWARFNVYPKDLALVREGIEVNVLVPGTGGARAGRVAYVSPVVDEHTRTITARVELENPDGSLRPGLFVSVAVSEQGGEVPVAVPREAVQIIDQREVVLVEEDGAFVPRPVRTGASDGAHVEILEGLAAGTPVVVQGAFEIKAQITTSGLGSHAGHGH